MMRGKDLHRIGIVCLAIVVLGALCVDAASKQKPSGKTKKKDYYELLGLTRSATPREIKKACILSLNSYMISSN